MKILFLSLAALILSQNSFAKEEKHACVKILKACKEAGYTKGGHKTKKGLFADCMKPIMAGETVTGVNGISPEEVQTCKAKHDKRHAE